MNRDEILNMEVGREMDALVAEKVTKLEKPADAEFSAGEWVRNIRDIEYEFWPPFYSTDIAAAWEVVEKMESDDCWIEFSSTIPNSDPIVYECRFMGRGIPDNYACEFTAPLAICRAALLAVMETE